MDIKTFNEIYPSFFKTIEEDYKNYLINQTKYEFNHNKNLFLSDINEKRLLLFEEREYNSKGSYIHKENGFKEKLWIKFIYCIGIFKDKENYSAILQELFKKELPALKREFNEKIKKDEILKYLGSSVIANI